MRVSFADGAIRYSGKYMCVRANQVLCLLKHVRSFAMVDWPGGVLPITARCGAILWVHSSRCVWALGQSGAMDYGKVVSIRSVGRRCVLCGRVILVR